MAHDIVSSVRIDYVGLGGARKALHRTNLANKPALRDFVTLAWTGASATANVIMYAWPWAAHPHLEESANDNNVRWAALGSTTQLASCDRYPGNVWSGVNLRERDDYGRYRGFTWSAGSSVQGDIPFGMAAVIPLHAAQRNAAYNAYPGQLNGVGFIDLGITQIGSPYMHPVVTSTCSTSVGLSYVTVGSVSTTYGHQHLYNTIRIESGADRGLYYVHSVDRQNNRLYLRNMDGSQFVAQATAAGLAVSIGYRPAYFNETGVIPNSAGSVLVDGLYDPGEARNSYIFRVHIEKGGSPSPANEAQRGSYWLSLRGWMYGHGSAGSTIQEETATPFTMFAELVGHATAGLGFGAYLPSFVGSSSVCNGMAFDRDRQRMWLVGNDTSSNNPFICYWNYKSPETLRDVASATASHPLSPPLVLPATGVLRMAEVGSDYTVYVPFRNGNTAQSGFYAIKQDFTWQFVSYADLGIPAAGFNYILLDRTRARSGAAGDVTTTADGHVQSASASFTAADVGRCIKIVGNAQDNGTYLISARNSATDVTVTQLNGSAVAFTGGAGGTFSIGDRIYVFIAAEATFNAGRMTWLDSLAFGTKFTQNVAMTAGAQLYQLAYWGAPGPICVDPTTSRIFWHSVDGVKHFNMFDPSTGLVTQRPLSDLAVQVPGSSANPTAPTTCEVMAVNPNSYFRELWVGTDQGHFKFDPDNFGAQFTRYFGANNTTYSGPDGVRLDGSDYQVSSQKVVRYGFLPDGQVIAHHIANLTFASLSRYNRQANNWVGLTKYGSSSYELALWNYADLANGTTVARAWCITPYGDLCTFNPAAKSVTAPLLTVAYPSAIHYQWIGGAWVPKEVVRGTLPDATSSPGLSAKPLHAGYEELLMGVRVKFNSSGAVGGENNEFLGRACQIGLQRSDGSTTTGTSAFVGSGFSTLNFQASDLGRYYVRIESGASQGIYKILTVTNDNAITLKGFNAAAFSAAATEGSLQYTVWDLQAGTAVGPEVCSFLANTGYARDNTQDISSITGDFYTAKATLAEQAEGHKVCTDVLPPMGSSAIAGYAEGWTADYRASMGAHLGLAGAITNLAVLDGARARALDGTFNRPTMQTPRSWMGTTLTLVRGYNVTFDFGTEVEIGSIIMRGTMVGTGGTALPNPITPRGSGSGIIVNVLKADDTGAPANSSEIRCSGSGNLNGAANATSISTSGDFLGTATAVTANDGAVNPNTLGSNVFQSAAGRFSQANVGMILKVTSGGDAGNYRILSVNGDGSQVTVRNLDQTVKIWAGAATGLSFTVYDGVQEEDLICVPSLAVGTHKLVIEYLSNDAKTAYTRTYQNATITNQNWQCVKPTWQVVKRLCTSSLGASPPDVSGNGTFASIDGRENLGQVNPYGVSSSRADFRTFKCVFDFSDLATARRRGRYWRWASQGRDNTNLTQGGDHTVDCIEFYDPAGKRLFVSHNALPDTFFTNPQYLATTHNRVDFIQSSDGACSHLAGHNGLANLGGANGDQVTLVGDASFLGYQIRPRGTNGSVPGGSNVFNGHASDPSFSTTSDITRFLKIHTGPNAGVYRIATAPSGTQVTLVTAGTGGSVTLSADAGPVTYSVHEGINSGTTMPDFLYFTTGGNRPGLLELPIFAISDDLKTITLADKRFTSLANQNWEIRRRALEDRTSTGATAPTVSARLLFTEAMYPYQSGDIAQDATGFLKFWAADIGSTALTAGVAVDGTDRFQSSVAHVFTPDDVGRVLLITSGVNKGPYRITARTSTSEVSLVNFWTGAAANLTGDASVTYTMLGERRFRMSRYVTCERS